MKATTKIYQADRGAVQAIHSRQPTTGETMSKLLPEFRARAFAVANLADLERVVRIQQAIERVPQGESWQRARQAIAKELAHDLEKDKARHLAQRIVRSEVAKAISVARYQEMTDPEEMALFPYWQYKSVGDSRTRSTHKLLHGVTLPANDPFWREHFPPWDYGCRCKVVQITKRTAQKMREAKDPRFFDIEDPRLPLLRTGHLEVDGKVEYVFSPRQTAAIPSEEMEVYYHNPGDLHLDLSSIRGKYLATDANTPEMAALYRKAFETFAARCKTQTVQRHGRELSVWDWLCESDLLSDAQKCLARSKKTEREHLIVRAYDLGDELPVHQQATENSVRYEKVFINHTTIHSHPHSATPSPEDIISWCSPFCKHGTIAYQGRDPKTHESLPPSIIRYTVSENAKEQVEERLQPWAALSDEAFAEREDAWQEELTDLEDKGLLIREML